MSEILHVNRYHNSRRKRALDFVLAGALNAALSPVEKLAKRQIAKELGDVTEPADSYFKQERVVGGAVSITLHKLRTMRHGDVRDSQTEYGGQNPRVAGPIAKIIRLLKIDELPQLSQVVSGEMSIVSPRALPMNLVEHIEETVDPELVATWKSKAIESGVRAGLTGPNQVADLAGFSDGCDLDDMEARVLREISYMDNANLRRDVTLIGKTLGGLTWRALAMSREPQLAQAA